MAYDIVTMGGLICEVMRKELDRSLDKTADFTGPYPSGDSAIMLNAAARLGAKTAMIGVVGEDSFGKCVTDRLIESGADCSMVRVQPGASSGVAFVCYYSDGSREFLYHVQNAASGLMGPQDIHMERLNGAKWVHITGFTMSMSDSSAEAVRKLVNELPRETRLSFDPNIRPEQLSIREIIDLCKPVTERADVIFPSRNEAKMFTGLGGDNEGCRLWAEQGKIVVLKNAEEGSIIYTKENVINIPGCRVEEVDPTGAGDTFCGAFLTALCEGKNLRECGKFANAAGAMSVRKQGPMEGAPSREELEEFINLM